MWINSKLEWDLVNFKQKVTSEETIDESKGEIQIQCEIGFIGKKVLSVCLSEKSLFLML